MSESESDCNSIQSGVSISSTATRRSERSGRRCITYTEESGGRDSEDSLKRRLGDLLGSDSGSDKDYVPDVRKAKRKKLETEATETPASDDTDDNDDELDSGIDYLSVRSSNFKLDVSSKRPAMTKKAPRSRLRRKKFDLSTIFLRPSVLKQVEGDTNELIKGTQRWRAYQGHLRNCFRILQSHGDTGGICSLLNSALESDVSLFRFLPRNDYSDPVAVETVYTPLCLMIVDAVNNHILNKSLRATQLKALGRVILRLPQPQRIMAYIYKLLLDMGAIQEAKDISDAIRDYPRGNRKPLQTMPEVRIQETLLELISHQESLSHCDSLSVSSTHSKLASDALAMELETLQESEGLRLSFLLPIHAWYLDEIQDSQAVLDMLSGFLEEHPTCLEAHRTLINYLTEQNLNEETLIQALEQASDQFPYEEYAVQYCQMSLRREESLDDSFTSEDEDVNTTRIDRVKLLERLLRYLDFRDNRNDTKAWELLVNLSFHLVHTESQGAALSRMIEPRRDWWFDQNTSDLDTCGTRCVGKKLTFIHLVFGPCKLADNLKKTLENRREVGDPLVDSVLADFQAHTRDRGAAVLAPSSEQSQTQDFQEEWDAVHRIKVKHDQANTPCSWLKSNGQNSRFKHYRGRSLAYLRNFLYLSKENQHKTLEKFIDEKFFQKMSTQPPKVLKKVEGHRGNIIRCLKMNIQDKRPFKTILSAEGVLTEDADWTEFGIRLVDLQYRIHLEIDFQQLFSILDDVDPWNGLESRFAARLIKRTKEIVHTKLNPSLALEKAVDEVKTKIQSVLVNDKPGAKLQTDCLKQFAKDILDRL